jgi:hypothetical protein
MVCEHVEPEEFLKRATSRARLERTVHASAGLVELLDPETGSRIVVEASKLDRYRLVPR